MLHTWVSFINFTFFFNLKEICAAICLNGWCFEPLTSRYKEWYRRKWQKLTNYKPRQKKKKKKFPALSQTWVSKLKGAPEAPQRLQERICSFFSPQATNYENSLMFTYDKWSIVKALYQDWNFSLKKKVREKIFHSGP